MLTKNEAHEIFDVLEKGGLRVSLSKTGGEPVDVTLIDGEPEVIETGTHYQVDVDPQSLLFPERLELVAEIVRQFGAKLAPEFGSLVIR